ncbi:MAG: CDP-alcohol phosphatidyltransferase family protein [Syntrophobacteraceae bacterium]|nr:CDP-alcohol phosphatidyltransferase family protein [Syntrophobacteraceae bacterium]
MMEPRDWRTKPTDRFVLKWIKIHLSSRITPRLVDLPWLRPWMITLFSASLGVMAGAVFAMGCGWVAGCLAATSQVFDGVDGQLARLTGRQSKGGAYWDSVLDRYTDGAMVMGMLVYLLRLPLPVPTWLLLATGFFALVGSNCISYSTARAESLGITLGKPTLASKGTRSTVMVLGAWGSLAWAPLPFLALLYLVLHTNMAVLRRLMLALAAR